MLEHGELFRPSPMSFLHRPVPQPERDEHRYLPADRDGDLILNVEFIDARDGTQLWGAQLRQDCQQGIDCSEQVARKILQHLLPILSPNQRKVVPIVNKPASSVGRRVDVNRRKEA